MSKEQVCADGAAGGKVIFGKAKDYSYADLADVKGKLLFNGFVINEEVSSVVMAIRLEILNGT